MAPSSKCTTATKHYSTSFPLNPKGTWQISKKKKKNKNIYILKHADWVNKIGAGFLLCPASPCAGWSRHKCLQQSLLWCTHGPRAALPTPLPGRSRARPEHEDGCLLMLRRWWPMSILQMQSFSASWNKSFPHCMQTPCTATGTTFNFSSGLECQMDPVCSCRMTPFSLLHKLWSFITYFVGTIYSLR